MADHKSGRSRSTAYLKSNSILYGGNMEMNMAAFNGYEG